MDFTIRAATVDDCKDMERMIRDLAEYERMPHHVTITQKDLERDGFSKNPLFQGIIAEVPEQHRTKEGHVKVGYALFFYAYSSRKGPVVQMEDLYVMAEFRGKGIGKSLMKRVAQAAGCSQLNFLVMEWNRPSLEFYFAHGCFDVTLEQGYHCMCCEGSALERLAQH